MLGFSRSAGVIIIYLFNLQRGRRTTHCFVADWEYVILIYLVASDHGQLALYLSIYYASHAVYECTTFSQMWYYNVKMRAWLWSMKMMPWTTDIGVWWIFQWLLDLQSVHLFRFHQILSDDACNRPMEQSPIGQSSHDLARDLTSDNLNRLGLLTNRLC